MKVLVTYTHGGTQVFDTEVVQQGWDSSRIVLDEDKWTEDATKHLHTGEILKMEVFFGY